LRVLPRSPVADRPTRRASGTPDLTRHSRAGGGGGSPRALSRAARDFEAAREWARFFQRRGRKAWCQECRAEHLVDTSYTTRRLRNLACVECGGRLRPRSWFEGREHVGPSATTHDDALGLTPPVGGSSDEGPPADRRS